MTTLTGRHGAYTLIGEHGRGAVGVTYRARRVADDLDVVVKVLRLDRLGGWGSFDLFERESAVLRNLSHPGIPSWLDHFPLDQAAGTTGFALVQTLVEGQTLAEVMRTPGAFSADDMLAWFEDLLTVLEYLHGRVPPVIHRDVNPKNVILRTTGGVALVDFGSVQAAVEREGALATTSAGTFGYAAPEQFLGRVTPACDLYGAGMTFLATASGRAPAEMPIDGLRVNVPAVLAAKTPLVRLLARMTEADPRVRLGDAAAARAAGARLRRAPSLSVVEHAEPVALVPRARPAMTAAGFLADLRARLAREDFVIEPGGEAGLTPLEFRARRSARLLQRLPALHVHVARAESLEGHAGEGPLRAPAIALLASAAGALPHEDGWLATLLATLLSAPTTVVVVVVSADGMAPHAAERVEAALRTATPPVLVAAVACPATGSVDLMLPAASGEARATVRAYLASLLGNAMSLSTPALVLHS